MSLEGHGAVVTGGGRGIGAAIARTLAAEGVRVVVTARTAGQVEAVAAVIEKGGGEAHGIVCDVADPASIKKMADQAEERLGNISILINNAGIAPSAPFLKITLEEWELAHRVNATGPLLCSQAFLPGMLKAGWGRIVNVASVISHTGARYVTSYAASKHALLGMTRCLATELAGTGVTVNSVCPGYVDSPLTDANVAGLAKKTGRSEEEIRGTITSHSTGGRLVTVAEVAHGVMTFVSESAGSIQGSSLVIDGGGLLR